MKVALVCDWYHPRVGGIELHLQDLAAALSAAGHDVVVITPTPGQPEVDGIRVVRIEAPRAPGFEFLYTSGGVRAVGEALAHEQVDVAHCHVSIVSPAALGGAAQAVRRRIPTVVTFHSVVPQTGWLARAARYAIGTAGWPAMFTAVSGRVARDVAPICAPREIALLPNGIHVDQWSRTQSSRTDNAPQLISVMRLNPKKRPLALINMMRALNARLPGAHARLRIVGDGPERRSLERAISRYGLRDQIELLGRSSRTQIRDLLSTSDIFVLPTVRESFGIAALEARCAGLPVVAMAASGVAELIEHGQEGLLADSDLELADHVVRLIRDSELRESIAGYNQSSPPDYDWTRVLEAHVAVYREAIALRDNALAETNR